MGPRLMNFQQRDETPEPKLEGTPELEWKKVSNLHVPV